MCYDNGCASLDEVALTERQWKQVRSILEPEPGSAAEERERLREAIALMERFVGRITGTWQDKGGTFNFDSPGQMDCVDESINTTMYLTMFHRYAQQSYGFNYYGTIGTNRDEFVVVRKMDKVDWLDTPADPAAAAKSAAATTAHTA